MHKILKSQIGFSLLEVVIATTVISVGLVGILGLVIQNIAIQQTYKNTLVASMLAQEGLELARNSRDKNWLTAGADYNDGLAPLGVIATSTIYYDYNNKKIATSSAVAIDSAAAKLYLDANGFYINSGTATSTIFSRIIVATVSATASSTVVKAEVGWSDRGKKRNYIAETILYDWR